MALGLPDGEPTAQTWCVAWGILTKDAERREELQIGVPAPPRLYFLVQNQEKSKNFTF